MRDARAIASVASASEARARATNREKSRKYVSGGPQTRSGTGGRGSSRAKVARRFGRHGDLWGAPLRPRSLYPGTDLVAAPKSVPGDRLGSLQTPSTPLGGSRDSRLCKSAISPSHARRDGGFAGAVDAANKPGVLTRRLALRDGLCNPGFLHGAKFAGARYRLGERGEVCT